VFNPFFTTKPTGKGTGLGLSITHDIMKSHGGYIRCTSNQGKGAEFTLEFPVS
jgi:signal transduction histidine kinase